MFFEIQVIHFHCCSISSYKYVTHYHLFVCRQLYCFSILSITNSGTRIIHAFLLDTYLRFLGYRVKYWDLVDVTVFQRGFICFSSSSIEFNVLFSLHSCQHLLMSFRINKNIFSPGCLLWCLIVLVFISWIPNWNACLYLLAN